MARDDKEIIHIQCTKCKAPIEIKWGTYRKSKDHNHLCWKCKGENKHKAWKKLSKDEKKEFHEKRSKLSSDGYKNMSQEDRDRLSEAKKNWEARDEETNTRILKSAWDGSKAKRNKTKD